MREIVLDLLVQSRSWATPNATGRTFAAPMGGTGAAHQRAGETYLVNYTSGGQNFSLNGHF